MYIDINNGLMKWEKDNKVYAKLYKDNEATFNS